MTRAEYPELLRRAVPAELQELAQWVVWRLETRDGKPTKVPYQTNGKRADTTDPATWTDFDSAVAAVVNSDNLNGAGFVFGEHDPFSGIDFDHCRDAETGQLDPWAVEQIDPLDSYCEVSPSGTGVKVFVRATIPGPRRKQTKLPWPEVGEGAAVEMYDRARFFTVTGHKLNGCPATVEPRQEAVAALYAALFPETPQRPNPPARPATTAALDLSDADLLDKARQAHNGAKFRALYDDGDTSDYSGDDSAADLALVSQLVWWCDGDTGRADRLFRQSALYRKKWEREDYRRRTFDKALSGFTKGYRPQEAEAMPNTAAGRPALQDSDDLPTEEELRAAAVAAARTVAADLVTRVRAAAEPQEPAGDGEAPDAAEAGEADTPARPAPAELLREALADPDTAAALATLAEHEEADLDVMIADLRAAVAADREAKPLVTPLRTKAKAEAKRARKQSDATKKERRRSAVSRVVGPEPAREAPAFCPPGEFRTDDIGNAQRLVALYGHRLRWCYDWKTWLAYDGTRWGLDGAEQALTYAKETARSILREALAAPDVEQQGALAKHGASSATRQRLDAMIALSRPDLAAKSDALDADPDLLNCRNGVVDLRTGELLPHRPALLLTRRVEAEYHADADLADTPGANAWRKFITDATGGDTELAAYLQRAAGYSLTGDPNEEVFFFAFGPANTGKSTFLATIGHHLADYAEQANFTAFLRKREETELLPELAKLQGKRFVASSETNAGRALAEGLVKTITGNEPISTTAKYQAPITWRPAFTLWLAANDRPEVRHDDGALWRRLKVTPFVHQKADPHDLTVPEEQRADPDLKKRLRETAGEAVLAWLVRGCLAWRQEGLGTCAAVTKAVAGYRDEMDPLAEWLAERCEVKAEHTDWFAPTADLYRSYSQWCNAAGEKVTLTQQQLGKRLADRKIPSAQKRVGGNKSRGFSGIRLTEQPTFFFDEEPEKDESAEEAPNCPGSDPPTEPMSHLPQQNPGSPQDFSSWETPGHCRDSRDSRDTLAPDSAETDPYADRDEEGKPW